MSSKKKIHNTKEARRQDTLSCYTFQPYLRLARFPEPFFGGPLPRRWYRSSFCWALEGGHREREREEGTTTCQSKKKKMKKKVFLKVFWKFFLFPFGGYQNTYGHKSGSSHILSPLCTLPCNAVCGYQLITFSPIKFFLKTLRPDLKPFPMYVPNILNLAWSR